jgi:hypothetical protein
MHQVLVRYGINRLDHMDRATRRVIRRYEYQRPGELVHVDIKKLGNIPDGGGAGKRRSQAVVGGRGAGESGLKEIAKGNFSARNAGGRPCIT